MTARETVHEPVDLRDPTQFDLAVRIGTAWTALRRGATMIALRDHLLGTGDDALEQGQMDTLDLLADGRAWRMSEVADALRVDPSSATRAVQRLVNAGLASRKPHDDDGRVVMVAITDAGRSRHADAARRRGKVMKHLLESYTPEERAQLADLLDRFVESLDDYIDSSLGVPR